MFEIASCSVWTLHEVMYEIPWQTVLMMLNDRGKTKKKKKEEARYIDDPDEASAFLESVK